MGAADAPITWANTIAENTPTHSDLLLVEAIRRSHPETRLDNLSPPKMPQPQAAERQKKYEKDENEQMPSNTFLERRSVQAPVERDYLNRYNAFLLWCSLAMLPTTTVAEVDKALVR